MNRAEELFLRIKKGGAKEVDRMIKQNVVEELFLDYKGVATAAPFKKLDPSDRKNLAKAISGFANSEGGVIVWGVDCRHNPPHGDIPTKAIPITDPTAYKSLLEGAITGVTLPPHGSIENAALKISGQTSGFVVTHVPIGLNVPYRTLVEKEEYYIRAGSNFHPTPHAVLAGLFGRAPHPELNIIVRFRTAEGTDTPRRVGQLRFDVSVVNNGRGIAEGIFFGAETKLPIGCKPYFIATEVWERWSFTKDGRDRLTMISKSFPPLPPGSENTILELRLEIPADVASDIVIDLTCGARNGPGVAHTIVLPAKVLEPAIEH